MILPWSNLGVPFANDFTLENNLQILLSFFWGIVNKNLALINKHEMTLMFCNEIQHGEKFINNENITNFAIQLVFFIPNELQKGIFSFLVTQWYQSGNLQIVFCHVRWVRRRNLDSDLYFNYSKSALIYFLYVFSTLKL